MVAHMDDWLRLMRTAQYEFGGNSQGISGAAFTMVANTLYAVPFWVTRLKTFDRIAVDVTAEVAGKSIRLGIYNDGTNLYPGTLVLDAGTVSAASTGLKAVTISKQLTKGLYWLAAVSDGTPGLKQSAPLNVSRLGNDGVDFGGSSQGWSVSFTYAALPNPFTAGGSLVEDNILFEGLRLLSLD